MFRSFFLAGFECATGYNVHHQRIDQVAATQHDRFIVEDYRLLREIGIRTTREAIRWPLVDRRGRYDFSTVHPIIKASRAHGIEVIYDLFHFGYPDDVNLFSDEFPKRFAAYCYAVACYLTRQTEGICYFTPINEPSYFAWAGGDASLFAPYGVGRGWELKVQLVRAAIEGINAIRAVCPAARIINADSLCRVVAPQQSPQLQGDVDWFNSTVVFESLDMLSGRMLPELGGSPQHLDITGVNYYWTNQWEWNCTGIPLRDDDPRRWPLRRLIQWVWERYQTDIVITETSHVGEMRPVWLRELTHETEALLADEIPLHGICLYPILGMPEWHDPHRWTQMGLWDLVPHDSQLLRQPYTPMLDALRQAQRRLEPLAPVQGSPLEPAPFGRVHEKAREHVAQAA